MPTIYIDNQPYSIEDGERNLLEVCLSLGFNLTYFCWHPALHSVGACRQCAVKQFKDEHDTRGRIVMACMTPAKDGTRISIDDPEAAEFRNGVIEWLMLNHPHDCPVCDEGGECHLQDMTVMAGHTYRRTRFPKRTHRNQNLGPFVNHEMNRCIQCYRCVRFYRDYAGGSDFNVFGWHDHLYFGRHQDGVLESEFSGNLVEVCPTGVFTDKTLRRHYTRKWDLQTAPSICVHCGVGCNTIPGERYQTLRRIQNRFNGEVNGYFLCDRGRYGYEFVNSDKRLRQARLNGEPISATDALGALAKLLRTGKTIGIGSPRASLEANFALRALVGTENFYHGLRESELRLVRAMRDILQAGPAHTPSLQEIARADAVFILGEDVTNTAPMIALALRQAAFRAPAEALIAKLKLPPFDDNAVRQAVQDERGPFFVATSCATKLDALATATYRATPDDLARLGGAVAQALDANAPAVSGLPAELQQLAKQIADALRQAAHPVIVSGYGSGSEAVLHAAANVARALTQQGRQAGLCFTMPECNSLGASFFDGNSLDDAVQARRAGHADTVIVLENDLYRRLDVAEADALLGGQVIALDQLDNAVMQRATLALPAATFAEADGTLVNNEGRAQRFFQVFVPKGDIRQSWEWLGEMMVAAGKAPSNPWPHYGEMLAALASLPVFAAVPQITPPPGFRVDEQKIPRQSHRVTGRTAVTANVSVHEPAPPADPNAPLAFSMEGYSNEPPAPLIPRFWAPGWNSQQAVNKFQSEVGGPLHGGDPGRRLIEVTAGVQGTYFTEIPAAFAPRKDALLLLPAWHIFGSEELSVEAPGIAELAAQPYVLLNPADAQTRGIADGHEAAVVTERHALQLPARLSSAVPAGAALLPVGLRALPALLLPAWGSVRAVGQGGQP